jgi:hypothetical protein
MASIGYANTVLGKLTKKMYQDGLPEMFITMAPYVQKRIKRPLPLGTDMTRAYQASWQEGVGAAADTDDLQVPSAPVFRNPNFDAVDIYNTLQLTAKEIERTKDNKVAMAKYLKTVITGGSKNFWRDMEFRVFNDATAKRGVVEGGVASGSSKTVTMETGFIPLRGLRIGMKIAFWNETTGQKIEGGVVITSVNIRSGTFVVETLVNNIPDAAGVYNDAPAERNADINGLENLVGDSTGTATVLGLSSSLSDWQSLVLGNSGTLRNITFELLDEAYYNSKEQANEEASEAWMNYVQIRKLIGLANRNVTDPRSNGATLKMNTHNEVEFIGSAKVMLSDQVYGGKIYNLVADDFAVEQMRAYSPVNIEGDDGAVWERIPGTTKYESVSWWSGNHTCEARRKHTKIIDLITA